MLLSPRIVNRVSGLQGISVANYDGSESQLVRAFKARGSLRLGKILAAKMCAGAADFLRAAYCSSSVDSMSHSGRIDFGGLVLIPAPSAKRSFRHRGYSPALLLARALKRELAAVGFSRVSVANALSLSGQTEDQAGLGKDARRVNLQGKMKASKVGPMTGFPGPMAAGFPSSISAGNSAFPGPTFVLVDDIVTTGATLLEMERALADAGLEARHFVTFAETL
jgi:predicted amidophosphoribosyltransferase